jgi:polyhydroxybutyrate depolymerase
MVFAPAGTNALQTERLMGFTQEATRAGFIVAYADHSKLGLPAARELATIPRRISEKWCIDTNRIFLTGHSDGGTISHIAALLPESRDIIRGIAPSAAGVVAQDLQAYGCRNPMPAMIMHSKNDSLFPGFGKQTAQWWAQCNRCDTAQTEALPNGCIAYKACTMQAPTWYCEGDGGHREWPKRNATMIEFFAKQLN